MPESVNHNPKGVAVFVTFGGKTFEINGFSNEDRILCSRPDDEVTSVRGPGGDTVFEVNATKYGEVTLTVLPYGKASKNLSWINEKQKNGNYPGKIEIKEEVAGTLGTLHESIGQVMISGQGDMSKHKSSAPVVYKFLCQELTFPKSDPTLL